MLAALFMSYLPRIGIYLALFTAFAVGAQFLQSWLSRQTEAQTRSLDQAAVEAKRHQFERVLANRSLTGDASISELAAAAESIGATLVAPEAVRGGPAISPARALSFAHTFSENKQVRVSLPPPPASRLLAVYQRVTIGLLLLGLGLFLFGFLVARIGRRGAKDESASQPWNAARAEAASMVRFAQLSQERTEALAHAQEAKLRVEEDLEVNRAMLDQSLAARVDLGRELHDNICQTLYAVCLTLESVQKKNTLAPELRARVDQCMIELKRVNQEVRAYLWDLNPVRVNEHTFDAALRALIKSCAVPDGVRVETRVSPEAIAHIRPTQTVEIMNILREALSNALRHGGATHVDIRAASSENQIALSVHDNGCGFEIRTEGNGHGLANMQTRAKFLGGDLKIDSTPEKGTRLLLTIPVTAHA